MIVDAWTAPPEMASRAAPLVCTSASANSFASIEKAIV